MTKSDELYQAGKKVDDLQQLKLIRALLFYLVFAFNECYIETIDMCKMDNKIFIPLAVDYYDDEWKN